MRVYGWQGVRPGRAPGGQTREIVAAASVAEVRRITGSTRADLFNLEPTGNAEEIRVALERPGTVFWRPIDDRRGEWRS